MKFWKMQAAGNDFVVLDGNQIEIQDWNAFAKNICDRHFGVGADGVLICGKSEKADIRMHYYNSDGSRGEMCGNGIRCLSRFVYENKLVTKEHFWIETDAGLKEIRLQRKGEEIKSVRVDMGFAEGGELREESVVLEDGMKFSFFRVKVGVPHIVIFVEEFMSDSDLNRWGKELEEHSLFPAKTNVNFVQVKNSREIMIKTWERGAGRTLGCATGSCAVAFVAHRLHLVEEKVAFHTEGGFLEVSLEGDRIILHGGAQKTFQGEFYEK